MFTPSGHLYRIDQVPDHFKEVFILHGYRHPKSTPQQCVKSLFEATNETLNVWTHLLPTFLFVWRFMNLLYEHDVWNDAYTWPLFAFAFVCCSYPLTSAVAHMFNTMSSRARHICFFFDYSALSMYSLGSAIAYKAYSFPTALYNTAYADWYVHVAICNAIGCTLLASESRFLRAGKFLKFCRLSAFAFPYLFDTMPIMLRVLTCDGDDCNDSSLVPHSRQYMFVFMAAFLYATHMPERIHPGKFDIIGHSHQLFHICGVIATNDQMNAILYDLEERKDYLLSHGDIPSFHLSIGAIVAVALINLITIGYMSQRLTPETLETMEACGKEMDGPCCH